MASVLLYLGILFTIAVPKISAQGPHNAEPPGPADGNILDIGLRLVPAPLHVIVQRKTPVLLNCSIVITDNKLQPLKFSWRKDGKVIDLSKPRPRAQLFSNGSLLLRPRRKKGRSRKLDGLYSCIVTSSWGSLIARRVKVIVASIDREFTKNPLSQEVSEGSVARFECSIKAKPRPYYVWNKNNIQLPRDDPRITILPSGVLQIRNVMVSDAGGYWCQAQAAPYLHSSQEPVTDLPWIGSDYAQLTVIPSKNDRPLKIIAPPKNVSVMIGETAYLECLGDAWPLPLTTWKRLDGRNIVSNSETTNLVITNVMPQHDGVYQCSVTSGGKTVTATAILSVIFPPKVEEKQQSHLYPLSRTFNVECNVEGNPTPTVSWFHNGVPIKDSGLNYDLNQDSSTRQRLIFYNARIVNSGFYQCVASNLAGEAISVSLIRIEFFDKPPPKPEHVSAVAINSTVVTLKWTHEFQGRPYVILSKAVGKAEPEYSSICHKLQSDGQNNSCNVTSLEPYTTYSFSIQAFSVKSASERSEQVEVTTLEDVPKKLPVVEISSPQAYQVNVSWTPLPISLSRGEVTKYKIIYRSSGNVQDEKEVNVRAPITSYLINGVEPDTTYEILVVASTKKGFTVLDAASKPWVTYTTPELSGMASPHFNFIFVNMTSVVIQWQAASVTNGQVTGYTVQYWPLGKESEEKEHLPGDSTSHILYGLEEDRSYEVTLIAETVHGPASPTTREFRMLDLSYKLVPTGIRATHVTSESITISWSPVRGRDLQYEVCYGKIGVDKSCQIRDTNSFQMDAAEPFTRYEFIVRVLIQDWEGEFSHIKRVDTKPGLPSPPVNLTVALLKKGSVVLRWQRPSKPNGDIVSYVIQYGKGSNSDEIDWKKMTVTGVANTYQIDDLEPEEYQFKLGAETHAGLGKYTTAKSFVAVCPKNLDKCKVQTPPIQPVRPSSPNERLEKTTGAGLTEIEYVAIFAGIFAIIIAIILIVLFCRKRCLKNRDLDPNTSHTPIYPSANGHIPSVYTHTGNHGNHRPLNGHAYPVRQTSVDTNSHEFMPMIQIDEHDLPDSKGDSDAFIIPNGLRMNGYIKHYYHNRPALLPMTRLHGDSNSTEEMRGLMSGDGGHTTLIMSSSLDDMDGSSGVGGGGRVMPQRGEDHSSEDSGTGSSRAPARFVGSGSNSNSQGLASPASSPGSCSSHGGTSNNTLPRPSPRYHHNHPDGFGQWGDEIGGVRIDPSTGTVIGLMETPHRHHLHQCHSHQLQAQHPSSSASSLSSPAVKYAGKDDGLVWVKGSDGSGGVNDGDNSRYCELEDKNDNDVVDGEGDRDSGHGSEVKMNHTTTNITNTTTTSGDTHSNCDDHTDSHCDYLPSYTTSSSTRHCHDTGYNYDSNEDINNDTSTADAANLLSGDSQQLSLPLPPPPPPLTTLPSIESSVPPPSSSSSSSSSASSSSQQLLSVNSKSTPQSSSSRNRKHSNNKLPPSSSSRRVSNRLVNSSTSECDELPPPPPPPPTVTKATPSQAADEGSSTTSHSQLGTLGVEFSSSPPSSSHSPHSHPPHENRSTSKKWNLPSNIA